MADFISARIEASGGSDYLNRFEVKSFSDIGRIMEIPPWPLIWNIKSVRVILFCCLKDGKIILILFKT